MKKTLVALFAVVAVSTSAAFGQQFRTAPRVVPQPEPPRPPVEQGSNSSWFQKLMTAPNKLQLVNPAAPARYGSGQQVVASDIFDYRQRPRFLKIFSFTF
ncbi:MAG: hypothetical protein JOY96_04660 [Verrucomicrobia bacterium]|nr:hypothetical protein [Verrucomicrobiota bacterium]